VRGDVSPSLDGEPWERFLSLSLECGPWKK
jgi:hypothetical protein